MVLLIDELYDVTTKEDQLLKTLTRIKNELIDTEKVRALLRTKSIL